MCNSDMVRGGNANPLRGGRTGWVKPNQLFLTFSHFNYKIKQLKVVSSMDQCLYGGMNGFNSFSRIIYTNFANSDAPAPQYGGASIW